MLPQASTPSVPRPPQPTQAESPIPHEVGHRLAHLTPSQEEEAQRNPQAPDWPSDQTAAAGEPDHGSVNTLLRTPPGNHGQSAQTSLPSPTHDIGRFILTICDDPFSLNGHFCDVFEGVHSEAGRVALKRPRGGRDEESIRRFKREGLTWGRLQHPHILQFLGTFDRHGFIYLVSPLINNGTLVEYIRHHPKVNRIRLLCETADAINYLHQNNIVHGDIKGNNILIDDDIHCLVCDFGLAKAASSSTSAGMKGAGTVRWQSPELGFGEPKSFSSDVYAFAMTIVEVLTEKAPFTRMKLDSEVTLALMSCDERPFKFPESLFGVSYRGTWEVAEACWPTNPADRIPVSVAFQRLTVESALPILTEDGGGQPNWHERDRSHEGTIKAAEMDSFSPTDDIGTLIMWISKDAISNGRFFDIFEGKHSKAGRIAMKRPRIAGLGDDEAAIRRLKTEAIKWRSLRHPYILKFLGTVERDGHIYLVSPFIHNGNVLEYIKVHPRVNRISLLCEVAHAIKYLHEKGIVHGDIKGSNVLIDDNAHCLLSDFGLSKMEPSITSTAMRGAGRHRWESPELWFGKPKSFSSDAYAFAMTIAEVLSGAPPFAHLELDTAVMLAVINNDERPPKSPEDLFGLSNRSTWEVAEACWSNDPEMRISMSIAFLRLQTASSSLIDDIGSLVTFNSSIPINVTGHFADIFEGIHPTLGRVALKRPRTGGRDEDQDFIRRLEREAQVWRGLRHPHILEFLGTFRRGRHLYFASPFIPNGTILEYIPMHPGVNRIRLLCEAADAITYLHESAVLHGDIKARNLLISDSGQVLLCDFGLTRTTDFRTSTAMKGAGSLRWQSPELWSGGPKSFESDVYAFGMTIVEVLTGNVPFSDLLTDGHVIRAVLLEDKRPPKNPAVSSAGLSYENVWAVAEACWSAVPEERIRMSEALQLIQEDPALTTIQEI